MRKSKGSMTGWVMLGLLMSPDGRQGWEFWEKYIEPKEAGTYSSFKKVIGDLEDRGFLARMKPAGLKGNASLAKCVWFVTEAGAEWWESEGAEQYGPLAQAEKVPEPPTGKWLSGEKMSRAQWTMMIKRVREGKFQVAFRPSPDDES